MSFELREPALRKAPTPDPIPTRQHLREKIRDGISTFTGNDVLNKETVAMRELREHRAGVDTLPLSGSPTPFVRRLGSVVHAHTIVVKRHLDNGGKPP